MKELDDDLYLEIKELCAKGDALADEESFPDAIIEYNKAFSLLPEPITEWEASTWILTAIADTYFLANDFENALQPLIQVMHCPGAIGNAFIHLRLGQVQFELGNTERAKDELARAYMGAGEEIFEDDDPKYLKFIKKFLR